MAEILKEHGIKSIAISYTNNDYGKGLADAIDTNFKKMAEKSPSTRRMKTVKATTPLRLAAAGGEAVPGYVWRPVSCRQPLIPARSTCALLAWWHPLWSRTMARNGSLAPLWHRQRVHQSFLTWQKPPASPQVRSRRVIRRRGADPVGHAGGRFVRQRQTQSQGHGCCKRPGTKIYPGELGKALTSSKVVVTWTTSAHQPLS